MVSAGWPFVCLVMLLGRNVDNDGGPFGDCFGCFEYVSQMVHNCRVVMVVSFVSYLDGVGLVWVVRFACQVGCLISDKGYGGGDVVGAAVTFGVASAVLSE